MSLEEEVAVDADGAAVIFVLRRRGGQWLRMRDESTESRKKVLAIEIHSCQRCARNLDDSRSRTSPIASAASFLLLAHDRFFVLFGISPITFVSLPRFVDSIPCAAHKSTERDSGHIFSVGVAYQRNAMFSSTADGPILTLQPPAAASAHFRRRASASR